MKEGVPAEDPKFDAVTQALKAALSEVEMPDQDMEHCKTDADDAIDRWAKVKAELDSTLREVEALIPNAEKGTCLVRLYILYFKCLFDVCRSSCCYRG